MAIEKGSIDYISRMDHLLLKLNRVFNSYLTLTIKGLDS